MQDCNGTIAQSIGLECDHPLTDGFKGRAVAIPVSAIDSITTDATNPRIVSAIALKDGSKCVAINNASAATPFTGSTTTGNNESGRARFAKIFACLVPLRGADISKDLIEAMVNDPEGFIIVAEKKDKRGNGSFEVIGLQSACKVDPTTVTRDESANGGAWAMSFTCTEDYAECDLFVNDYDTTKDIFDDFYQKHSY